MRILLADDNHEIIAVLRTFLEKAGHSTDTAPGGRTALDLIIQNNYEIAFLDEDMPELTGLEIVEYIRKNNVKTKSVILTGYPCIDEKLSRKLGADEYLTKPVSLQKIEMIVAKYAM